MRRIIFLLIVVCLLFSACSAYPVPTTIPSLPASLATPVSVDKAVKNLPANPSPTADSIPPLIMTAEPNPVATRTRAPTRSPGTPPPTRGINLTNLTSVQRDLTYCIAGGIELKMDIYFPSPLPSKPVPVTIYVHGGSWSGGDKTRGEGTLEVPELTRRGYIVAAVNYRLAPKFKFPAQIEDVKCAVRYLRANADLLNIDPNRIGAWGGSAGGHLVALAGLAGPIAGFEGNGGFGNTSSRVQAVVDFFGPADLTRADFAGNHAEVYRNVFGLTSREDPILKRASPVTYVSKDSPPFLLVHGSEDKIVLPNQSEELYSQLKAAGVPASLVIVRNGGHGFIPVGGPISPNHEEIVKMVGDFFDKYLRQ